MIVASDSWSMKWELVNYCHKWELIDDCYKWELVVLSEIWSLQVNSSTITFSSIYLNANMCD
jgi:hypothetical protein